MPTLYLTSRGTPIVSVKGDLTTELIELPPNIAFIDAEDAQSDAQWTKVIKFPGDAGSAVGWIQTKDLVEAKDQPPRPTLHEDAFVAQCVARAWTFNEFPWIEPFYVDADYLLALAAIQSGLSNSAGKGPKQDRFGPFGVTQPEWNGFVTAMTERIPDRPFLPFDFHSPIRQVACASFMMHSDAKALSELWRTKQGVGTVDDPYLPRFAELLRCRLIGVNATFDMQVKLKDHAAAAESLAAHLQANGYSQADAEALMTDRKRFMRQQGEAAGEPFTLRVFHDKCVEILNRELKAARSLIIKHVPETIEKGFGAAPWMEIARAEMDSKVNESTAAGRARIEEYFDATGFSQGTAADKWCAAFVAWCISKCPSPIAESYLPIKNVAAGSVHWRKWGNMSFTAKGEPPFGAIAIISPSKNTNAVSHVGFFKQFHDEKRQVTILGGNQSNEVNETNFDNADIIEFRWLQTETTGAPPDTTPVAGTAVVGATNHDIDVLAQTIFGEARGLSSAGRQAVGNVMLNRLAVRFRKKKTLAAVCQDPAQFSCWNEDDPNLEAIKNAHFGANAHLDACRTIGLALVRGELPDLTGGALHYYSKTMKKPPWWVGASANPVMTHQDDGHYFYKGID